MNKEAIILAGGFGTRLQSVIDVPKPMAPINKKPFLAYLLDYLSFYNFTTIHLSVGYKHELIQDYFGENYKGIKINYVIEKSPLGTGGAVKKALSNVKTENVFIINGDTFFQVDFDELELYHYKKKAEVTMALKPMINFDRYGTVNFDYNFRINNFAEKKFCTEGNINGGTYLINTHCLDKIKLKTFSLETDFFEKQFKKQLFYGFICESYFIDIGIPNDYTKAQLELPQIIQ